MLFFEKSTSASYDGTGFKFYGMEDEVAPINTADFERLWPKLEGKYPSPKNPLIPMSENSTEITRTSENEDQDLITILLPKDQDFDRKALSDFILKLLGSTGGVSANLNPSPPMSENNPGYEAAPKRSVTKEGIEAKIANTTFHQLPGTLMVCVLTLENGFSVTGESACVDPANFNLQIGQDIARANAFEKIWQLEGYLLKEEMYQEKYLKMEYGDTPPQVVVTEEILDRNPSLKNVFEAGQVLYPRMRLISHKVNAETLQHNPEMKEQGVEIGDTVTYYTPE